MVNRALAEAIVNSLQLSGESSDLGRMKRFSLRDWERTAGWLDNAGLHSLFSGTLRACGGAEALPAPMLARFEQNLADNKYRVDGLVSETRRINQELDHAGIQYSVIKGLSQCPAFCANPYWRVQSDLDYLVASHSLGLAQSALEECGYERKQSSGVQVQFEQARQRVPSRFDNQYKLQTTPHS